LGDHILAYACDLLFINFSLGVLDRWSFTVSDCLRTWHRTLVWTVVMQTLQFEAVKVALKQDKTGYVLTLCLQPDEIPEELLRDWVGARYQVVMVRLNGTEEPMNRQDEFAGAQAVKRAGILSNHPQFWQYLVEFGHIPFIDQQLALEWLREFLGVKSRTELKTNLDGRRKLDQISMEFSNWTRK
jgi:hypothetical protein